MFQNKIVLITGGSGGIGLAAAKAFAKEGAKLALVDLKMDALEKAENELALQDVLLLTADVTKEADVEKYVADTLSAYGRIDVFINNAGVNGDFKPIVDQSEKNYDSVMSVNVKGVFLGLKHVLKVMKEQNSGAIVNSSSNAGLMGVPGNSVYVASKHAVIGLTKSAALEVAGDGIRINAVCPSGVDTNMMKEMEISLLGTSNDQTRAVFTEQVPMKRYAEAEEIANLMLFLASNKASFITGGYHRIDGGGAAGSA